MQKLQHIVVKQYYNNNELFAPNKLCLQFRSNMKGFIPKKATHLFKILKINQKKKEWWDFW